MAKIYKKVNGRLIPADEVPTRRLVQPGVSNPIVPLKIVRGYTYFNKVDMKDDVGADGAYNFFMTAPVDSYHGNFLEAGIKQKMDVFGIKLILYDGVELSADAITTYNAIYQGIWTLKFGQEVDVYTGNIRDIAPIMDTDLIAGTPNTYIVNFTERYPSTNGFFPFEDEPGKIDRFFAKENTTVWVEFAVDPNLLPATIPTDIEVTMELLTLPEKEILLS